MRGTDKCGSASGALVDEFDPATNTITAISDPGDTPVNFINLPNGQVMAAAGTRNHIYTPTGSPQNSWRPTVTGVSSNGNDSYQLSGTQLSGLVSTGEDDFQAPENYPIASFAGLGRARVLRQVFQLQLHDPGQAGRSAEC